MKKIILDVDTGIDDAIGILLACASEELDVLGITTVSGNIDLKSATRNTLRVLKLIDRLDVPVYAGADAPLERPVRYATEIHGSTGLAGQLEAIDVEAQLSAVTTHKTNAIDFMIDTLRDNKGEITIVMTAPETNFAKALEKSP